LLFASDVLSDGARDGDVESGSGGKHLDARRKHRTERESSDALKFYRSSNCGIYLQEASKVANLSKNAMPK
jgi:hypothetical protein